MTKTELTIAQKPDYAQLLSLFTAVKGNIALEKANVTKEYKALVGNLGNQPLPEGAEEGATPTPHTVVSYIAAKIAEVNGAADTLAGKVKANEDAIALLNNTADVIGSVKYMISQEFNTFVTKETSDNIINTFKEMVDYLKDHPTEYANLALLVGSLPEDCQQTTVVAYAKALVEAAEARIKAIEDDYLTSSDKTELETAIGNAKDEAIAAVQGDTENTVKDLEDAFLQDHNLTEEQMNTLLALFPTSASAE